MRRDDHDSCNDMMVTSLSFQQIGYDLLDFSHETRELDALPRVTLQEDEVGGVHLCGLSMRPVRNEDEAFNLLFLGDTNRAIAETPMNMASSRSHCIFTVRGANRCCCRVRCP